MVSIHFPKVLRIEPASSCSLSCIHCPTATITMDRGIMNKKIIEKILQEVTTYKNEIQTIVLYHGGEPLLNKNFFFLTKELKKINPSFFIKTVSNGTHLTPDYASKIIAAKLDAIEFSIDGISSFENEFIRKKSQTKTTISNINNLISLKEEVSSLLPTISISTTQFYSTLEPELKNPNTPQWIINSFPKKSIKEFKATYAIRWPHMNNEYFEEITINNKKTLPSYCDHIMNTMTIRYDGTIVACCYDLTSKLVMGNIISSSLKTIWNNQNYSKLRKSIENRELFSICATCSVINQSKYLIPKWRKND